MPRVDGITGPAKPLDLPGLLHLALLQGNGGNVDEFHAGAGLPEGLELLGRQDVELRADLSRPARQPGQGACENLLEPPLFCQLLPADEYVLHGKLEPAPYIEGVVIGADKQAGGLGCPRVVEDIAGIDEKGRGDPVGGKPLLQSADAMFHVRTSDERVQGSGDRVQGVGYKLGHYEPSCARRGNLRLRSPLRPAMTELRKSPYCPPFTKGED